MSKDQTSAATNADHPWVVTTEMLRAYAATRGSAGVEPNDAVRRAVDIVDAGKPDGEWCTTEELCANVQRAPLNDDDLTPGAYSLLPPANMPNVSAAVPGASSETGVVKSTESPAKMAEGGEEKNESFQEFVRDFATAKDGRAMTSEELHAAVPDYEDGGYITDNPEDPHPPGRISPRTLAFFADGCKRWDTDPNKPCTPEVPENGSYNLAPEGEHRGNRSRVDPNGKATAKVQIDEDTGSVMSGEYSVSPNPSLVLNPPGNARDRHLKSDIDITLFDRMNNNGHATGALADIRNDPVAVVNIAQPAPEPDVETFTDEEVREALYDDKVPGALWKNVPPKNVERQLQLWRSTIDENKRQEADAEAWATHNQVCLDSLERQKQEILEMVHSRPELIAKRNRAARIREHIAKTVRSVKDEYDLSHVKWRQAEARGAAIQAQVETKKKELTKLCREWGFGFPADVYVEFDRVEDFKARE